MKALIALRWGAAVWITLLFMAVKAEAQSVYYVRVGATGARDGSDWSNAYTSLPAALQRGATYYIAGGNYPSRTFQDAEAGTTRIVIRKATAADHGSGAGWQDSYGSNQAVFQGSIAFGKGYYTIDGVSRTNWQDGYGVKVNNHPYTTDVIVSIGDYNRSAVRGITLRYVDVEGSHSRGTNFDSGVQVLWNADNFTAQYCSVHDVGSVPFFLRGSQNSLIEYCYVARNTYTSAVHSEGISASEGVNNFTVRYNWWEDLEGTACITAPSAGRTAIANWYIYGNVFDFTPTYWSVRGGKGFGNGIISLFGCDVTGDLFFYNNTIVNVDAAGFGWGFGLPTTAQKLYVKNNLWYKCTTVNPIDSSDITDLQWEYNAYFDTPTSDTDAHKQVGTGDPTVDWANGNFHLKVPTAAGFALPPPYNADAGGNSRGQDSTWERGAWGYAANDSGTNPVASVKPVTQDFGPVAVGVASDLTFTVENVGGGTLAGTASASPPFRIISGDRYSLEKHQRQTVRVRYSPTMATNDSQTITFTGGGGGRATVIGIAK